MRVEDLCSRFHLDFIQSSVSECLCSRNLGCSHKDYFQIFISLRFGEFIGKPLIQLSAQHFDLSLLKQKMSFSKAAKRLGNMCPIFL